MSVARHHAEWLSLVETSGPFLSMPVLMRVFPQGLERRNTAKASRLREAYEDWLERGEKQPAVHHAWIRHVLTDRNFGAQQDRMGRTRRLGSAARGAVVRRPRQVRRVPGRVAPRRPGPALGAARL